MNTARNTISAGAADHPMYTRPRVRLILPGFRDERQSVLAVLLVIVFAVLFYMLLMDYLNWILPRLMYALEDFFNTPWRYPFGY